MEDCQAFANLFSNTCKNNAVAANVASLTGSKVSCSSTGQNCVDSGSREAGTNKCSFERKLCVACIQKDSKAPIKMRVQSNGLPLNYFNGTNVVREQNIDFELFWNPKTGADKDGKAISVVNFDVNSNDKYSKILCEPEQIKNTWASNFSPKSGSNNLNNAIGVTLDGVILMPNLE